MKPSICTASGIMFNVQDPDHTKVNIEDVAHALSHICRFTGHTKEFYSVAQHSVHVASYLSVHGCSKWTVKFGLLHDAHEAYVNDIAAPLKTILPDYNKLEDGCQLACEKAFGLIDTPQEIRRKVKEADLILMVTEARDLMKADVSTWGIKDVEPWNSIIETWSSREAKEKFLLWFDEVKVIN